MTDAITGHDLIKAGMKPGKWLKPALEAANAAITAGGAHADGIAAAMAFAPPPALPLRQQGATPFYKNIIGETPEEQANIDAVSSSMIELMRTPVISAGAVMPDACPAGGVGTIPVGGVAVSEGIHPGMHSADICCSMAISVFPKTSPADLLDAVHGVTHFGPGGRSGSRSGGRQGDRQLTPPTDLLEAFEQNRYLKQQVPVAIEHFGTQGDGNHFAFVGTLKSTGETALVTHHGSRAPGARLYKEGMKLAEHFRRILSPETLKQNAWIPADTAEGETYWAALQIIRAWTKANHLVIHDQAATKLATKVSDRFWNEHNFVFRRSDGLFYHAKGATPAFDGWADDATDLTLIPLNMAEPVLIARGRNAAHGLGFSPHGAGRNFSRRQHKRLLAERSDAEIFAEETAGIDARFYMGTPDISELPSAYKNAAAVRAQIEQFDLAEIVDEVIPHGSIMAGDWQQNAPWRQKKPVANAEPT
ncbi:MAG: RtcB family protein [Pseudomonadota bacterium]